MQDRFKWRAWNTRTKTLKEVSQISFDDKQIAEYAPKGKVSVHLKFQPHYILMQCTGLKDKNGKLIFEGDILRSEDTCRGKTYFFNARVYWAEYEYRIEGNYHTTVKNPTVIFRNSSLGALMDKAGIDAKVIGNIYENSELLS